MCIAHQCRKRNASHAEGPKSFRGGVFFWVFGEMTHHFFYQETDAFVRSQGPRCGRASVLGAGAVRGPIPVRGAIGGVYDSVIYKFYE